MKVATFETAVRIANGADVHGGHELLTLAGGATIAAAGILAVAAGALVRRGVVAEARLPPSAWARLLAVLCSAAAGAIHFSVAPAHVAIPEEALFFVIVGWLQVGWGITAVLRWHPLLARLATIGNSAVIATWTWSRTTGLPIGATPGIPEAPGLTDVAATSLELGVIVLVAAGLASGSLRERLTPSPLAAIVYVGTAVTGIVLLATAAMMVGHHPSV